MNDIEEAIDTLIQSVDVLEVLSSLGAKNIRDQESGWVIHSCLIDRYDQHHTNGDANPSAALDKLTKRYSCFSYGVIPLKKLLKMAFGSNKAIYEFLVGNSEVNNVSVKEQLLNILDNSAEEHQAKIYLDKSVLEAYSFENPYMTTKRGISSKALEDNLVMYDRDSSSVVFSLWDNGDMVGLQRRNTIKGKPKYSNIKNFHKESFVYYTNGSEKSDKLVVVESIVSALKLYDCGVPSAATMGSVVFDQQLPKLLRHKQITIWFDDDLAGIKGMKNFLEANAYKTDVRVVVSNIRGKDPADMTREEILDNLSNSMPAITAKQFINKAYNMLKGA